MCDWQQINSTKRRLVDKIPAGKIASLTCLPAQYFKTLVDHFSSFYQTRQARILHITIVISSNKTLKARPALFCLPLPLKNSIIGIHLWTKMTYSPKPLNVCRAGQASRPVAVPHSGIMTGRHLASLQRGQKEGGDTSRLSGRHQRTIVDGHAINAV